MQSLSKMRLILRSAAHLPPASTASAPSPESGVRGLWLGNVLATIFSGLTARTLSQVALQTVSSSTRAFGSQGFLCAGGGPDLPKGSSREAMLGRATPQHSETLSLTISSLDIPCCFFSPAKYEPTQIPSLCLLLAYNSKPAV